MKPDLKRLLVCAVVTGVVYLAYNAGVPWSVCLFWVIYMCLPVSKEKGKE
jgi:hypothetical protein